MDKSKKKKTLLIVISALIVAIIAAVLYIIFGVIGIDGKVEYRQSEKVNANVSGSNVTVLDNNVNYQTLNGFGASACWWSQDVNCAFLGKPVLNFFAEPSIQSHIVTNTTRS